MRSHEKHLPCATASHEVWRLLREEKWSVPERTGFGLRLGASCLQVLKVLLVHHVRIVSRRASSWHCARTSLHPLYTLSLQSPSKAVSDATYVRMNVRNPDCVPLILFLSVLARVHCLENCKKPLKVRYGSI